MNAARHATAVSRAGRGVLLLGPPGAGKSDLALRLIRCCGFDLVADDQVLIEGKVASPPHALAGLLEVRGLGLVRLPWQAAELVLAVAMERGERLPAPARLPDIDVPVIKIDPAASSAPHRVALALDCLEGLVTLDAGALK